jgi:hypothetical protein
MKYCFNCAEELENSAKFCSRCGSKQNRVKEPTTKQEKTSPREKKQEVSKKDSNTKSNALLKGKLAAKTSVKKNPPAKPVKNSAVISKKGRLSYQEKLKAMYSQLPQDNCGECGCKNCYQFAMMAASPKNDTELGDCPYID